MKVIPKKSLGQNFLIDNSIINSIVEAGNLSNEDNIIEIGPGTGNLTKKILSKKPKKLFVIEKDSILAKELKNKFDNKINILNEDILKIDERKLLHDRIIVFGNLPYNISTKILIKWIRYENLNKKFKKFILMFQKEVADRIISETNKKSYGRLTILSFWKMNVKKIIDVPSKSFFPIPKVDSSVLIFEPKNEFFKINNVKNLEKITNIFFNQRRKMINKTLKQIFKNTEKISEKLSLNPSDRPQNLHPIKFFEICREYEKLIS